MSYIGSKEYLQALRSSKYRHYKMPHFSRPHDFVDFHNDFVTLNSGDYFFIREAALSDAIIYGISCKLGHISRTSLINFKNHQITKMQGYGLNIKYEQDID